MAENHTTLTRYCKEFDMVQVVLTLIFGHTVPSSA